MLRWLLCSSLVLAAPAAVGAADFEKDIRPLLEKHCVRCHNPDKAKARLGLTTAAGLATLEAKGLALGPAAERATLIRRVAFTLTGLPPTPAEIDAFVSDRREQAYECMVDRYLASPHYGEHWGRHWLDAAGYADTN